MHNKFEKRFFIVDFILLGRNEVKKSTINNVQKTSLLSNIRFVINRMYKYEKSLIILTFLSIFI